MPRLSAAAAALALAALLPACDRGPELAPLAADAVVLAYGDSITRGVGAGEGEDYPSQLSRLIGREVINAGVPGEVSTRGLQRLPGVLARVRPALVILCHGGNDILRRLDLAATARNLREMIQLARDSGAEVVLVGVPRFGLFLSTAEFYDEVARDAEVPLEADALPDILADNALKADTVHPNAQGYAQLARALDALLRARGALAE